MKFKINSKEYDELYEKYYKIAYDDKFCALEPDEVEKEYGALYLHKPYFLGDIHLTIPRNIVWKMYDSWKQFKDQFTEDEIKFITYMDSYRNNL